MGNLSLLYRDPLFTSSAPPISARTEMTTDTTDTIEMTTEITTDTTDTVLPLASLPSFENSSALPRGMIRRKKERVCASMYADPLHVGHLEYLARAKELAGPDGELVVIVNNDYQARLKKGRPFMPDIERKTILEHLRMVDEVWISIDEDRTVRRTIRSIDPPITMFVNGGDQTNDTIPERAVCEELGVLLVDGLGEKIQSSSQLTGLVALLPS